MKSILFAKWVSALFPGLVCLFLAATAHAHAEFRGSLPLQDSILDALPAEEHDIRMTHALTPGAGLIALGESPAHGIGT